MIKNLFFLFLCVLLIKQDVFAQRDSAVKIKVVAIESHPISGNSVGFLLMEFTMNSDFDKILRKNITSVKLLSEIPKMGKYCKISQRVKSWMQSRKVMKYKLRKGKWKLIEISDQNRAGESITLTPAWAWPLVTPDSYDTHGKITWTSGWFSGTPRRFP